MCWTLCFILGFFSFLKTIYLFERVGVRRREQGNKRGNLPSVGLLPQSSQQPRSGSPMGVAGVQALGLGYLLPLVQAH